MGDLSCILAVVHEQQLQLLGVVHQKLVKACRTTRVGAVMLIKREAARSMTKQLPWQMEQMPW